MLFYRKQGPVSLQSQSYGSWCFGHSYFQGISHYGFGQVIAEYPGFSTRKVKQVEYDIINS